MRVSPILLAAAAAATSHAARYPVPPATGNLEPVIGVLTVSLDSVNEPCLTAEQREARLLAGVAGDDVDSCFAAFYIKWLEASGARVVIIPYTANQTTLDGLLAGVNGVLFTGGGLNLWFNQTYVQTAQYIFNRVKAFNDAGVFLPLHGTCMGMQLLSILAAGDEAVLSTYAFDAEDLSLPLDFNATALPGSRLFGGMPQAMVNLFASANITENLHHDGVRPASYAASPSLSSFFSLISTNVDRQGAAFVSTLEAFDYPITATQWHVERPPFEHEPGIGLNHTGAAIAAMQYVGNFLIEDARRNNHTFFAGDAASAALFAAYSIYGYAPRVQNDISWGYQVYVFDTPT